MSVTRFYSLALGKFKNFSAKTDGLIVDGDTTPDVSLNSLLYANSTNTISYFDNGEEGQVVHVINLASEFVTVQGAQIKTSDSASLYKDDSVTFINHNSAWYEIARDRKDRIVSVAQNDSAPSVKGVSVLVLTSTAPIVIKNLSDGYTGQQVLILKTNSCPNILEHGVGQFFVSGSAQSLSMVTSDTTIVTNYGGTWFVQRPYGSWAS